jgi:hypothetical protein
LPPIVREKRERLDEESGVRESEEVRGADARRLDEKATGEGGTTERGAEWETERVVGADEEEALAGHDKTPPSDRCQAKTGDLLSPVRPVRFPNPLTRKFEPRAAGKQRDFAGSKLTAGEGKHWEAEPHHSPAIDARGTLRRRAPDRIVDRPLPDAGAQCEKPKPTDHQQQ